MTLLRRWPAAPARLSRTDVLLAVAVAGAVVAGTAVASAAEPATSTLRELGAGGYTLVALGGLALVLRRTAPTAAVAATLGLSVMYEAAAFPGGPDPLPVVVALYGLAARGHRLRSLGLGLAATVVLIGVRGLAVGDSFSSPLIVVFPTTVVAAVFAGQLMATVRNRRFEEQERVAAAERDRERDTRRQVDAERLRIARELHDVVAHNISLINVQATMGVHLMDERPQDAAAALGAIKSASKQALGELRRILDVLRQPDEDEPTAPAPGLSQLDGLVTTTRQAGLPVVVEMSGPRADLPATVDVAAYRIVQESLTNALRYAGGADTRVHVSYRGDWLNLLIEDDGPDHPTQSAAGSGHGIAGMRERAAAVGGTLRAGPGDHGGFTVTAQLPLTATP